ncbi:hypothetical protein XH97_34370, partial [Bradyrhizobium sp. CCBAU 53380]|nr:hypothetical protein [Bradyrhizobium sp. CCBAU 53380]
MLIKPGAMRGQNCCCRQTTLSSLLPVKGAVAWQTIRDGGRDLKVRAGGKASRDGRGRRVIRAGAAPTGRAASRGR